MFKTDESIILLNDPQYLESLLLHKAFSSESTTFVSWAIPTEQRSPVYKIDHETRAVQSSSSSPSIRRRSEGQNLPTLGTWYTLGHIPELGLGSSSSLCFHVPLSPHAIIRRQRSHSQRPN
jgi:hypothetical protein